MTHRAHCQTTDLIHNRAVRISACPCGIVCLHLGPVSLRISESAFAGLADAVAVAFQRLSAAKADGGALPLARAHEEFLAG